MSEIQTGGVSEDPGRIIYELDEKLKTANATIISQTAEIDRLRAENERLRAECADAIERLQAKWQTEFTAAQQLRSEVERLQAEWQSEFTAAQQLRSEVQQLEGHNHKLSEALRDLQEDHTAMDHRAEGARLAFLDVIKTLGGVRS